MIWIRCEIVQIRIRIQPLKKTDPYLSILAMKRGVVLPLLGGGFDKCAQAGVEGFWQESSIIVNSPMSSLPGHIHKKTQKNTHRNT